MKEREDQLNGHFAQSDFKLDEGEVLLKEMQQLRDELSQYEDEVQRLIETAGEIVPLRARRERLRQPIEAVAICKYQNSEVTINCGIFLSNLTIKFERLSVVAARFFSSIREIKIDFFFQQVFP
jgi:hypothetical protein